MLIKKFTTTIKIALIAMASLALSGCFVHGVYPKGNTFMDGKLSNYCFLDASVAKDCYAGSYSFGSLKKGAVVYHGLAEKSSVFYH